MQRHSANTTASRQVLEDLVFRLPKLRDLEDEEQGKGVEAVRDHFKW
jgi:hypothetical protein